MIGKQPTSFQKRGTPKFPTIPGTKPSLYNFQLLTSTGIPSLDVLLGGGLPLGTVLLVEDHPMSIGKDNTETESEYSNIFAKYFSAEGAVHKHELFYGSSSECPKTFFENLPEVVKPQTITNLSQETAAKGEDESLKIAWRYQNQSQTSQPEKSGHHFNIQKSMTKEDLDMSKIHSWIPPSPNLSLDNLYIDLYKCLKQECEKDSFSTGPSTSESKNILRTLINDIGSIMWAHDNLHGDRDNSLVKFVFAMRALARQHMMVVLLTISKDSMALMRTKKSTLDRVRSLCDFVVELTPFNKDQRQNGLYKDHHGVLKVEKIPNLSTLRNPLQDNVGSYLFKSLRTKFMIEKMHLPPSIGEDKQEKEGINKLDF